MIGLSSREQKYTETFDNWMHLSKLHNPATAIHNFKWLKMYVICEIKVHICQYSKI